MKILVTGGSGRIGGYALRELINAGHTVSSFSRQPPLLEGQQFIQGDVTDPNQIKEAATGHDAILHLAAIIAPQLATPEHLMQVNAMGTVHVLEAAVHAGVEKVVFASSVAVLGVPFANNPIRIHFFPIDETHPCEPQDSYGLSKLIGEQICRSYTAAYGIRTICLRIGSNWYLDWEGADIVVRSGAGPVRWSSVEAVWESYLERRENPEAGSPPGQKSFWDLLGARDTALACRLAVENQDILHDAFFILGEETCSSIETSDLVSMYYPDVPMNAPLDMHGSLVSHQRATEKLGYHSRQNWRESDFAVWLTEQGHVL